MSWADFTDFKVILAKGSEGCLVTDEEFATQYTPVEFGYVVNADGTVSRVAKDDPTSMGTIKGKSHSEHGITNFEMTVKVDGGVKIGMGTCNWGGDVKINGATAFSTNAANKCWHNDKANNIAYGHYVGEAGTITIAGGSYTAYVSVEAETVKSNAVAFSLGTVECMGTLLPEGKDVIAGESFTIPANYTLYKEGYTLTGWTDGTNTYKTGSSFVPTEDVTLTPVFTQNTKSLADRTEPVTVKWNFRRDQGVPVLQYEGQEGLVYVAQATVAGEVIDVKMDFSTKPGKVNNAGNNDWAQVNPGTKFTIPSCKGATVSLETLDAISSTTIDGVAAKGNTNTTYSTEIASKAETIDIVVAEGRYYRYIQVVLPVVTAPAGKTYTNEPVSVYWAMDAVDNVTATIAPADAISMSSLDSGDLTITGMASCTDGEAKTVEGVQLVKYKPAGSTKEVTWNLRTAAGLTFTPTKISGYVNRYGTDSENCVVLTMKTEDGKSEVLGTYTALRNGKTTAQKPYDATAIYKFEISLTSAQQAALTTSGILTLSGKIGVGSTKEQGYGQIKIEGTVSGTIADVNKYTVNIATTPAEGGSASIYPKSEEYVEGDEVTITATENFGYDFVNWTNAAGEEVSKEVKYKATVTANETYTANFKKVETYELKVNIDGGANDYMISYNPAPVVVDNKNMYEAGTKVTLTASENPILTFNSWSNGETAKEIVVDMTSAQELTAEFSAIDFIVGWDFFKAGNNGRVADFYAADNDAVSLVMFKEDGVTTAGWLDKSQLAAGGYEGRPGGVCWVKGSENGDVGHYYWQTDVNAEAFTNLKIQTAMVYNYNAYQKYDVQASLDGKEWETIGSINMPGTKAWTDLEATFPEKYNNQKKVYVRWIADKTSKIDGSASPNDGACIGATYITGTKKLVDDGVAPVLVKTVPAEGADKVSANGKIVLTFDEKVKVAENAKATLGSMTLVPVVSGKTVSFEYKALEYSTAYTFTLPANSVADLTDNYMSEAITINFQTKQKPAIEKGVYDAVVSNGEELAAAIKAANERKDQTVRYRIFVKKGAHVLPTNGGKTTGGDGNEYDDPRTYLTASNVSIIGEDFETTSFTNITPDATWNNGFGTACPLEGIGKGDVLINKGTGNYFQGITIRTSMGDAHGRDIAFNDQGNKTIFKNARLWGYQDTYVSNGNNSRYYFENGVIRGRTDYICGKGDVWYEQVTFQQVKSGYLAVPSQPKKYGYILNKCTVVSDGTGSNDANGAYTLGRPWGKGTPIALYLNCVFKAVPSAEGWSEMSGGYPARYAEYNSTTASGTVIDLSKRKTIYDAYDKKDGDVYTNRRNESNNPVLTAVEASEYSIAKVMGADDDWDPTAYTEQASAPSNVTISGTTLSWDDSNYVLCWAVIKNGEIVDFTTEPTYTVDDETATWSVRAANEMGGLGEATVATAASAEAVSYTVKAVVVADGKSKTFDKQVVKVVWNEATADVTLPAAEVAGWTMAEQTVSGIAFTGTPDACTFAPSTDATVTFKKDGVQKVAKVITLDGGVADNKLNLVVTANVEGEGTFTVTYTCDEVTAVNANAAASIVLDGKYAKNGKVVIIKNGKRFNAAGAQMK